MEKIFIGVDISKDYLDIAYCQLGKDPENFYQVANTLIGINSFIKKVTGLQKKHSVWICFEHTGNYGLLLSHCLENASLPYSAVAPLQIKRSIGITRGKNDKVDAGRIAQYASIHHSKLSASKLETPALLQVQSLLTYRDQLVRMSIQFKNSLKSHQINAKVFDVKAITNDIESRIEELKKTINELELKIIALIQADENMNINYNKITKITGIGPIIAAYLILSTQNFQGITDPRKLNCHAGMAPFENSSGTIIKKTRTSKLRNKQLKKLIFNGAHSAARYDGQLKTYYNRKRKEGKPHLSVINAIACKLIYRVYAVINRDEPFVKISQ